MSRKSADQISMSFSDEYHCEIDWEQFHAIIVDRGSRYSVTGGKVLSRKEVQQFLKRLKKDRKYAAATHNSWAARISREGAVFETKSDDGETGAGQVILHQLRKQHFVDVIVVVTRWFGGIKLQADRFKHLQEATLYWVDEIVERQSFPENSSRKC